MVVASVLFGITSSILLSTLSFVLVSTGECFSTESTRTRTRTTPFAHQVVPMDLEERNHDDNDNNNINEAPPVWDPIAQIYKSGRVPENANVRQMIDNNQGVLHIFGYGSLCWNPGTPGQSALAHAAVTKTAGRCQGYRRAWAQKSTDHRGWPHFPGLVCTLLTNQEFQSFRSSSVSPNNTTSYTEGLIYKVPPELVEACLAELDFREKGGYARDVVQVIEDTTGNTVEALLYRGTPDNPAFWPRALRDLNFAAAILATATGPSGPNHAYLDRLDRFLRDHISIGGTTDWSSTDKDDEDTFQLAALATRLRQSRHLHFLFGSGSNQHNQLLVHSESNAAGLVNGEDAHELKEIVLSTPKVALKQHEHQQQHQQNHHLVDDIGNADMLDPVVGLYAGGGHSGALTQSGHLYLWGWNGAGQLGHDGSSDTSSSVTGSSLVEIDALPNVRVMTAALGFAHTLLIEQDTGRLWACGDNARGQVTAAIPAETDTTKVNKLVTPKGLDQESFVHVAAGLFHSAAVTAHGELVTFGCNRFSQCLDGTQDVTLTIGRWCPADGCQVKRVACGRRHTAVIDSKGRVWTFGDNKYGQLGRHTTEDKQPRDPQPGLAFDGENGRYTCMDVSCGWSHVIILARDQTNGSTVVFGWGRNDKGQLGTGSSERIIITPRNLFTKVNGNAIRLVSCGSEWSMVVDSNDTIWSCGWNEHGNLATGDSADYRHLSKISGAPITTTPGYDVEDVRVTLAAGGAHFLTMKVAT